MVTLTSFINTFNNKLEAPVQQHLKGVYGCLAATTSLASIGAYSFLAGWLSAGLLPALGALGLGLGLMMTSPDAKNFNMRLGMLLGLGFLSGLGLGPLLAHVAQINPSIITTALFGTTLVFVAFSLSAIFAERGKWLFLGGIIVSVLNMMFFSSLANIFLQSTLIYQAHLYVGLFVMCAFVLYDTQAIIEKFRAGSRDTVGHAFDLFLDFIGIFKRLLIILSQKEENEKKKRQQ
ncbi:bax inhibitor 1-like [Ctenocephalides felis]|uniref:bax inhibitor 1-like n=1 Tax=Ctenocephalides felis TaxID=7515 RepID=UPI000E6E3A98|nr:bax inhibitor 1-like [Ctenocephalides felis]XP_026477030.1 bax inhibitor 1-like [Ctenocephalides felis]